MVGSVNRVGSNSNYHVRSGDTLSAIAARSGTTVNAILRANPGIRNPNLIYANQSIVLPAAARGGGARYTVRPGDTLADIAFQHGTTWQKLARDNNIANPNLIFPGQQIAINGGGRTAGNEGTRGPGAIDGPQAPAAGKGLNPADIAKKYLGQNASSLRSNTGDRLPMQANCPANLCCANFVSAVLVECGQIPLNRRTVSVSQLNTNLRNAGWRPVSLQDARPGDVVIIQGGGVSHTELYAGNGKMIGSNNSNADGSQRVGYDNISWAMNKGAVILRAPASVQGRPTGGEGKGSEVRGGGPAQAAGRFSAAQIASLAQRGQSIKREAMAHGFSEAEAIGIAANIMLESGGDHRVREGGGGAGVGLIQWTDPARKALFRRVTGSNVENSTREQQWQMIRYEVRHSEAGGWRKALANGQNAPSIAAGYCRYVERPANPDRDSVERAAVARAMVGSR